MVVLDQLAGDKPGIVAASDSEKREEQFHEPDEGDGTGLDIPGLEPIGKLKERVEWRGELRRRVGRRISSPDKRGGTDEVAAVRGEIPEASKAPEALGCLEIDEAVLKNIVGRIGVVGHLPLGVVT